MSFRVLAGLTLLGAMCLGAAAWQDRVTDELRRRQERQRGTPARETRAGWSTLILGQPSGALPFAEPESALPAETADSFVPAAGRPLRPDVEYVVRPGDTLSVVCQEFYEGVRPEGVSLSELTATVARYNGLASADGLRSGVILRLPDARRFVAE